jgi:ribonuclease M5
MKEYLRGVLVVEGKEDAAYLSNYVSSEIVVINGYEMSPTTINYLKDKEVILLVDPDEAGKNIRKLLNERLSNVINVEIDISKCSRGKKNGVAECDIEEIMSKLQPYFAKNPAKLQRITSSDLFNLGLVNKEKDARNYVCETFNLGVCNGKMFLKRLNENNISIEELTKVVEQYNHGNK